MGVCIAPYLGFPIYRAELIHMQGCCWGLKWMNICKSKRMYKTWLFSSCQKCFRTSWAQGRRSGTSHWLLAFPYGLCLIGKFFPAVIDISGAGKEDCLSAALTCLCEKTEGGILSAQVGEWMTLWAFLCSRLSVLYYQILLVLCLQHDRCDFTYKALILQLCVSKISKRKISSISLISLAWWLFFVCLFFVKLRHAREEESVLGCAADQNKSLRASFLVHVPYWYDSLMTNGIFYFICYGSDTGCIFFLEEIAWKKGKIGEQRN